MKNRLNTLSFAVLLTLSMQATAYKTELDISHYTHSYDIENAAGVDHNSSRAWDIGFTYYYDDISSNKIPFAEQAFAERTIAFGIDYLRERRDDLKGDELTGSFLYAQPDYSFTFGIVYDIFKRANNNDGDLVYATIGIYASPLTYIEGQFGQAKADNNFFDDKGDMWGLRLKRLSPIIGNHFIDFTVDYQIIEYDDLEYEDTTFSLTYYPNQSWGVGIDYNEDEIETNGSIIGIARSTKIERTTVKLSYFATQQAAIEIFYTDGKGEQEPGFIFGNISEEIAGISFIFR